MITYAAAFVAPAALSSGEFALVDIADELGDLIIGCSGLYLDRWIWVVVRNTKGECKGSIKRGGGQIMESNAFVRYLGKRKRKEEKI